MSQETQGGAPVPEMPRDPVRILEKVGLTPKEVEGKSIVGFGEGVGVLATLEGVTYTEPNMEYFYATDTLPGKIDIGVIVDHPRFQKFLEDPDYQDLLGATVGAAQQEVRLGAPVMDPNNNSISKLVEDVEMLLSYNYELERSVAYKSSYDAEGKSENPYLLIKPLPTQETLE